MSLPELRSEAFTRWARAAWPNIVGIFGLGLIFFDCIINPPPDTTSGIGLICIGATGFVKLNRHDKAHPDDE
jgi:hypothetical protein